MSVVQLIKDEAARAISQHYSISINPGEIAVNATKPEFEGDYTIVVFGLVKQLKKSPEQIGAELGELMCRQKSMFSGFNVIKGFLNLVIADEYWISELEKQSGNEHFGVHQPNNRKVMVEYSSPNTNKPLHLGHLRNNFLGWSVSEILKANGNEVIKTCIVNDRGVHICKSMIAWQRFGNGETPASSGKKGDHLVGEYYVKFNDAYKKEVEELIAAGRSKEEAEKEAPIMKETQQMLLDWEGGKPEVMELWSRMNGWVYEGFDSTYNTIGSDFDKIYYESNTYLLGKNLVELGLSKGIFYRKDDGSVWIDLTADGLDEKIVQRRDGTSVYITQDIGLAQQRHEEYGADEYIYVIGDEQNYHMKVLTLIAQKLELPGAEGIYHLSYGMVELPSGKMKSREGTVVDADDIVAEMVAIAKQKTEELGKVADFQPEELQELYETIGLGALKFFILRVDPRKRMIFNPEESIDFHGFTGPFIQYTHARIKSILRKTEGSATNESTPAGSLLPLERKMIVSLEQFPSIVQEAGATHDPSKIAIFIFDIARTFNSFYAEHSVANAESEEKKALRLKIARLTAQTLKTGLAMLGIKAPERM